MEKRISQADSARQIGLESTFQEVLILVESDDGGNNKKTRILEKRGPTLLVAQEPGALWTNGDDKQIQLVKLVYNPHSKKF